MTWCDDCDCNEMMIVVMMIMLGYTRHTYHWVKGEWENDNDQRQDKRITRISNFSPFELMCTRLCFFSISSFCGYEVMIRMLMSLSSPLSFPVITKVAICLHSIQGIQGVKKCQVMSWKRDRRRKGRQIYLNLPDTSENLNSWTLLSHKKTQLMVSRLSLRCSDILMPSQIVYNQLSMLFFHNSSTQTYTR